MLIFCRSRSAEQRHWSRLAGRLNDQRWRLKNLRSAPQFCPDDADRSRVRREPTHMRHDSRPLPRSGRREPLTQPQAPFDRAQLPSAEPARQRRLIHLMALVALAASLAYLSWRVAFTLGPDLW